MSTDPKTGGKKQLLRFVKVETSCLRGCEWASLAFSRLYEMEKWRETNWVQTKSRAGESYTQNGRGYWLSVPLKGKLDGEGHIKRFYRPGNGGAFDLSAEDQLWEGTQPFCGRKRHNNFLKWTLSMMKLTVFNPDREVSKHLRSLSGVLYQLVQVSYMTLEGISSIF